jgi:hypothetical protein
MSQETQTQEPESAAEFNEAFIRIVEGAGDGHVKGASAKGGNYVRYRLRENGFFRNILPTEPITDDQFDRQLDYDEPVKIEDMEPESPMAKSVPFNDTPDLQPFRGRRFAVRFAKITTPEFLKNIDELRTYEMDLRQVITDNALKDMETEEDARFIATVDRVVGPSTGNGLAGVPQNHEIVGRIVRPSYKNILHHLQDLDLNNGMFLLNRHTAVEFLGWDHDEWGGPGSETMMTEGLRGLPKNAPFGVPHLYTIKRAIIPDYVVYQFAEKSYMGKAYQLQEPTMYVKKEKDIIRFCAQEKLGFTIANVRSAARVLFTN